MFNTKERIEKENVSSPILTCDLDPCGGGVLHIQKTLLQPHCAPPTIGTRYPICALNNSAVLIKRGQLE